jgi:hypothetical protein
MAKKEAQGYCYFHFIKFLQGKWQKTTNRDLNSRWGHLLRILFERL